MSDALHSVVESLLDTPGPEAQRVARLALVLAREVDRLDRRIDALTTEGARVGVQPIRDVENEAIMDAVSKLGVKRAAAALRVGEATLYRRLKELRDADPEPWTSLSRPPRRRPVDRDGNAADPRTGAGRTSRPEVDG